MTVAGGRGGASRCFYKSGEGGGDQTFFSAGITWTGDDADLHHVNADPDH